MSKAESLPSCACVFRDPYDCVARRYNHGPDDEREECECSCHDEWWEERNLWEEQREEENR